MMSDRRRERVRLEISREAARLFARQGVSATSGEQIADAVGLSVRTIWRHFPNKESCAEPIVARGVAWFTTMLRSRPRDTSLQHHFAAERAKGPREWDAVQAADNQLSIQMVELSRTEPAIRSAWLMATDRVEREMVVVLADRLGRTSDDVEVRRYAAAAIAVVRVINEDAATALLTGQVERIDINDLSQHVADAVRVATGGRRSNCRLSRSGQILSTWISSAGGASARPTRR